MPLFGLESAPQQRYAQVAQLVMLILPTNFIASYLAWTDVLLGNEDPISMEAAVCETKERAVASLRSYCTLADAVHYGTDKSLLTQGFTPLERVNLGVSC